jgi:DNA polymerase kappa
MSVSNPYARKKRPRPVEETRTSQKAAAAAPAAASKNSHQVSADASALIISASDKAGMEGIDRTKIDAIILRESGNSKFMQQQRKRDEKVNQRIEQYQQRLSQASPQDYAVTPQLDDELRKYQQEQSTRSTCVVVDMDMFYMACELLTYPELKDRPACVGRGMILTSNYLARRYGVRSAMAGFIGDKLVAELSQGKERLIHVPSNFDLYKQQSKIVVEVLREYDPNLKAYSLDEAYLDIGPYLALYLQQKQPQQQHNENHHRSHEQIRQALMKQRSDDDCHVDFLLSFSPLTCQQATNAIVLHLRRRVEEATGGLTCSAGIAPNFALAKIASDKNKPNGQLLIDPNHVLEFDRPLPVRKMPGIGRVTEKILHSYNIKTVFDLYQQRGLIQWLFPPSTAGFLLRASVGCGGGSATASDSLGEDEDDRQKGISRERTFAEESSWTQLNSKLEDIARLLSKDMLEKSVMAHTITVKVKLDSFDVKVKAQSMARGVYIQAPEELLAVASQLLSQLRQQCQKTTFCCRLLGIRCSNLIEQESFANPQQRTMDKFLSSTTTTTSTFSPTPIKTTTSPYQSTKGMSSQSQKKLTAPSTTTAIRRALYPQNNETNKDTTTTTTTSSQHKTSSTAKDDDSEKEERVECPLCKHPILAADNEALNRHIDTCLNASTVRQAVREASKVVVPSQKKRHRLTDFW